MFDDTLRAVETGDEPLDLEQRLSKDEPLLSEAPPSTPSAPAKPDLAPGTILGERYEIREVIGRGGMGVVYRAFQTSANREVAIKVLRSELGSDPRSVRRFEHEAKVISKLRHPNTVRLFDCHLEPTGDLYIVTELLTGISLHRLMSKRGLLPIARAIRIADQVAAALSEAHAAGIVHRDIKPENVYIDWVGGEDFVKVIDFGIAKTLGGKVELTTSGNIVGTPTYISPEQARGKELTPTSDVYALGVLLYHMLTGAPPFRSASAAETVLMHLEQPPPKMLRTGDAEAIPGALEALVLEMLAKNADDRPVSMVEVRGRLRAVQEGAQDPSEASTKGSPPASPAILDPSEMETWPAPKAPIPVTREVTAPQKPQPPPRPIGWMIAAAACALLAIAAIAALIFVVTR